MTVRDLIHILQQCDPDLEVYHKSLTYEQGCTYPEFYPFNLSYLHIEKERIFFE